MVSEAGLADATYQVLPGSEISGKMGNQEAEPNFGETAYKWIVVCAPSAALNLNTK